MDFPTQRLTRLRTNNAIERLNRRLNAVQSDRIFFLTGRAPLMLVCARLRRGKE